jgi:hypothetical protein
MDIRKICAGSALIAASFIATACNSGGDAPTPDLGNGTVIGAGGGSSPVSPDPTSPSDPARTWTTDVMLFTGSGTWSTEIESVEELFDARGLTYREVGSSQLDAMSVDDLAQYGLLFFPGGSGGTEADSLSSATHAHIREAVQVRGVSYIGFCAGAFIAEAPAPAAGQDVSYGLGVVNGPVLDYYYLENQGIDIQMTTETFADGSTHNILWYGGPVTPNQGVIAKYPDGNPAISQVWSGKGFVIMSGVHPTLTQSGLDSLGVSGTGGQANQDIAWQLIHAALHQQPLPQF